jgi:hypothetical protein
MAAAGKTREQVVPARSRRSRWAAPWQLESVDALGRAAGPSASPDRQGFAAFGRVVQGMNVVRPFHAAPTDPAKGGECVRGQLLAEPVTIAAARRWP